MSKQTTERRRIGPILLSPGVTPGQIGVFLVVITITSLLFNFVSIIQPYLFSEIMHVPLKEQGRLTGFLNMVQYAAVAVCIIGAGGLSDKIGRKPVLVMAMVGFIVTMVLLPLASAVFAMVLLRIFLGVASTGHTAGGATIMVDYPDNKSRGKFITLMLVVQSVATALLAGRLLPQLPGWLLAHGFSRVDATRISLWTLAAFGVVGVLIAVFFLKPPPRHTPKGGEKVSLKSVAASARQVLALSKSDPAFGLVVLLGFVIRSDYFVTLSFLSVWVMDASKLAGVSAPAALKTVGLLQVVLYMAMAFGPLLFGFVADRVNRIYMLIATLFFAAIAFASTLFIHNVAGLGMIVVVGLIGMAETAQTVASQAVFGERAPPEIRGSAMGFFVLMGTISVIVVSGLAGLLFDKIGFTAPFMFLSLLNLAFAIAAVFLTVRRKGGERRLAAVKAAA